MFSLLLYRERLSHERERLEENSEKRLEIFKELVSGYAKSPDEEKLNDLPRREQAEPLVSFCFFILKCCYFYCLTVMSTSNSDKGCLQGNVCCVPCDEQDASILLE